MNFGNLKEAMGMRSSLKQAQKEMAKIVVEGSAGKGKVRVQANGNMEIVDIKIAPEALQANKTAELEKMIKQAVSQALDKAKKEASKSLMALTSSLNLPGEDKE